MNTKLGWFSLLFFPFCIQAQSLKPGIYKDLKQTEPLILDTGNYTFIGLGMKDLGNDIWLDARKVRKLDLLHCTFEGKDEGTAVLSAGDLSVSHSTFTKMKEGILQASPPGSVRKVSIVSNVFRDNGISVRLEVEKYKRSGMIQSGLVSAREGTNRGVEVFDLASGKQLTSKPILSACQHMLDLDIRSFPSGTYGYRLVLSEGKTPVPRKMVIVR